MKWMSAKARGRRFLVLFHWNMIVKLSDKVYMMKINIMSLNNNYTRFCIWHIWKTKIMEQMYRLLKLGCREPAVGESLLICTLWYLFTKIYHHKIVIIYLKNYSIKLFLSRRFCSSLLCIYSPKSVFCLLIRVCT
jgi:hypothetical protein